MICQIFYNSENFSISFNIQSQQHPEIRKLAEVIRFKHCLTSSKAMYSFILEEVILSNKKVSHSVLRLNREETTVYASVTDFFCGPFEEAGAAS